MVTISASEARQTLPAQLDRVEAGGEGAIARHGRVVAILVSPQRTQRTRDAWQRADLISNRLAAAREQNVPAASMSTERAEELIGDAYKNRSAR